MDRTVVASIAAFAVILALLVVLRARDSKFEVRPTDVVVAIFPVVIFLLVTGKIQKLQVGELNIETAFVKASTSEIKPQVTPLTGLPSVAIHTNPKLALAELPRLLESRTEGLTFRLGYSGYDGSAIREYLDALAKQPFFRYVIIENPDSTFWSMADARALAGLFMSPNRPYTADDFARWLASSDTTALQKLPGFLSSKGAVTETTDKSQALQLMESLSVDTLPVVNADRRFVGIVNRSRLTASMILEVANELKK
jgi:CBS domain-containing protein